MGSPLETSTTIVREGMQRRGIAEKMTYHLIGYARHELKKDVRRPHQTFDMIDLAKKMRKNKRMFYGRNKKKPIGPHEKIRIYRDRAEVFIKPIRRRK